LQHRVVFVGGKISQSENVSPCPSHTILDFRF
jgi:hypothetical protein